MGMVAFSKHLFATLVRTALSSNYYFLVARSLHQSHSQPYVGPAVGATINMVIFYGHDYDYDYDYDYDHDCDYDYADDHDHDYDYDHDYEYDHDYDYDYECDNLCNMSLSES